MAGDQPDSQALVDALVADATDRLPDIDTELGLCAELDVSSVLAVLPDDAGKQSPFEAEPLLRALLYKQLSGMPFYSDLANHLEKHRADAEALGFAPASETGTPGRSTLSRWTREYFNPVPVAGIVEEAGAQIIAHARETGHLFESGVFEPEPRGESSRNTGRVKGEVTEETVDKVREWLYPLFALKRTGTTKYDDADFFDLLVHMALTSDFANNGCETFEDTVRERNPEIESADDADERATPHGDTLLYHLKKFDPNELMWMFSQASDALFEKAIDRGLFDDSVKLAIDTTPWLFYGDTSTRGVSDTAQQQGTAYAYKFLTVCIIGDDGERFTVEVIPVTSRKEILEAIPNVIARAKEYVDVDVVMADRGFFGVKMVNKFYEADVNFLIRAQRSTKTKRMWRQGGEGTSVDRNYTMTRSYAPYESTEINLFVTPSSHDRVEHMAFITNLPVTTSSAETYADVYRERWGIETSYRVCEKFRAQTTSTDFSVRLFYFFFCSLLYNVWILVNAVVQMSCDLSVENAPHVTAKMFVTRWIRYSTGVT